MEEGRGRAEGEEKGMEERGRKQKELWEGRGDDREGGGGGIGMRLCGIVEQVREKSFLRREQEDFTDIFDIQWTEAGQVCLLTRKN